MKRLITFIIFLSIVQIASTQTEYEKLKEFPGILEKSYTFAAGIEPDENGEMQLSGMTKEIKMSIKVSSMTFLLIDHKKDEVEKFKIIEVGTYPNNVFTYYIRVKSETDQEEAEVLVNDEKSVWLFSYSRGGFIMK